MLQLSIIIPVYNVAPYLRQCVDSVLHQDLPPAAYEIILVDDGSTDGSGAICDDYAHSKAPVIKVLHQPNQGVAMARNNGVAAAEAPFVTFLDADDWWDSHFASKMLALTTSFPHAGLYACKYWYVKNGHNEDRVQKLSWHVTSSRTPHSGLIHYFKSYCDGWAMPIWTGAVVMNKQVFEAMGGFPRGIKLGEDFLLWSRTAMHYPIAYWDECLSYYNNDTPAAMRATQRLHLPHEHMLWHIDELDKEARESQTESYADWRRLCDQLRAGGLLPYWLSRDYHEAAAEELQKIDWGSLPTAARQWYRTPQWFLRLSLSVRRVGSRLKRKIALVMK